MIAPPRTIACFGEIVMRVSIPQGELPLQSARFGAHVGGAEANVAVALASLGRARSEEHTSELQSLMRNSSADFCLKKKIVPKNKSRHSEKIPYKAPTDQTKRPDNVTQTQKTRKHHR